MDKPYALVVDFDDTLIDSGKYKQNLFVLAKDFGVTLAKANFAYLTATQNKPFTIKRFSKSLFLKDIQKQRQFQTKARLIFFKPKQYNFLGVEKFLKSLGKTYKLYLLTYGEKGHQSLKIKQSQLGKFFDSLLVTAQVGKRDKLLKFQLKWGKLVGVLDDSGNVCENAKNLGLKSFKIKKGFKNANYYNKLEVRINNYFK